MCADLVDIILNWLYIARAQGQWVTQTSEPKTPVAGPWKGKSVIRGGRGSVADHGLVNRLSSFVLESEF